MSVHSETLAAFTATFVQQLADSGLRHAVVSPGSRSTPLAVVLKQHPDIKVWMNLDERSAGFFALGMAKAYQKPVILLCSSGTATANYYPAVIEARYSRVPLVVLTADRPHELREVGAPQAIDQVKMYGEHVRWYQDMPLPEAGDITLRYVKTTAMRAVKKSQAAPAGAVHVNFPFREPLMPDIEVAQEYLRPVNQERGDTAELPDRIADDASPVLSALQSAKRPLLIAGPNQYQQPEDLVQLAENWRIPILADPLSNLRSIDSPWVVSGYDATLRNPGFIQSYPTDCVIRFGAMPVSKPLLKYLERVQPVSYLVIDDSSEWREPTHLVTDMIYTDLPHILHQIKDKPPKKVDWQGWAEQWLMIDKKVRQTIRTFTTGEKWFEGQVVQTVLDHSEPTSVIFAGNSMPIRDVDTFYTKADPLVQIMANRGANGIDGVISTALGVHVAGGPVTLILGDLTFFHDMNGLMAAKQHCLDMTIVIINNNGGGIFSFLPQANQTEHFEELFGTPTDLDIESVARLYNGTYAAAKDQDDLRAALKQSQQGSGLHLIEVIVPGRDDNHKMHQALWQQTDHAIDSLVNPLRGAR